jgi:group I intron endonuclease
VLNPTPSLCYNKLMSALVYQITNVVNGHTYVGMTTKTARQRWVNHLAQTNGGRKCHLSSAIRKWGAENFTIAALEECPSVDEARARERHWIGKLSPQYNMTKGGEGVFGFVFPEEVRKRMSQAKLGRPAPWLSGPNADEIRKKLSASASKRVYDPNDTVRIERNRKHAQTHLYSYIEKRKRQILCVETGEIFASTSEVKRRFGLTTGSMCFHLKNGGKIRRCPYTFKYADAGQ